MIHEYALNPELLCDFNNCRTIFDNFKQVNGKLISDSPKKWVHRAYNAINQGNITPVKKQSLKRHLDILAKESLLKNRNAVIWDAKYQNWLEYIASQNQIYPYAAIISHEKITKPIKCYELGNLFIEGPLCWNAPTQLTVQRNATDMINAVESLLNISKQIILIDPHLYPHERKYKNVILEIVRRANNYNFGRGIHKIEINTSDRRLTDMQNSLERGLLSHLPGSFEIIVYMWPENMMHDRFIITDVAGFEFGHGLDEISGDNISKVNITLLDSNRRTSEFQRYSDSNNRTGMAIIKKSDQ